MAKETTLKEVGETLAFIVERMATKDDLKDFATKDDLKNFATNDDIKNFATKDDVRLIVREELRDVRTDLKSARTDLDELKDKVDNITGYRKEIDHALERIATVEKKVAS